MRFWFSGPRIMGIRPGVSLRQSEAAQIASFVFETLKWLGVALVLLYAAGATMHPTP